MNLECVIFHCSDRLAKTFVSALQASDLRLEVILGEEKCETTHNAYPVVRILSENVSVRVVGFPPQPPTERYGGDGRNVILAQYRQRDQKKYPDEMDHLLQSVRSALVRSGAELAEPALLV